jgi:hypothetical protein
MPEPSSALPNTYSRHPHKSVPSTCTLYSYHFTYTPICAICGSPSPNTYQTYHICTHGPPFKSVSICVICGQTSHHHLPQTYILPSQTPHPRQSASSQEAFAQHLLTYTPRRQSASSAGALHPTPTKPTTSAPTVHPSNLCPSA